MAASYLREKCVDFIWHSRGNQPKWSLRWRVGASENEWLHVAKKQNIYIECVERHADITSVLLELSSSENYFKWQQKTRCLPGENQGHQKIRNQEILKYYNTTKCSHENNFNYELRWTTNHHNSAVLRLQRAPPSTCPSPNRPRYQTCVWMDPLCMNDWTQCWGARFISSNAKPSTGHHPLPLVGGARSPAARVAYVRENGRMSWVCLAACVTGSMQGWVRTHARDGKIKIQKQHLERNKI